jgi:hypothetical protein
MVRTERGMTGVYGPVILTTRPAPRGFISRYILSLTPVVLVALSLVSLPFLNDLVNGSSLFTVASLKAIMPELPQYLEICVLLIAPVGIFLFFIWLGDVIHCPEIWIATGLTLLLSGIGALVMIQGTSFPILSTGYLLMLFKWVAYLVQPFSVIAAGVVIVGVEAFRRTLQYTLTRDAILITGGIWNQVENIIPLHQITGISLVQGRLGHLFNFGTVVPAGKVFGLSEIDMTGHHAQGDLQHPDSDQLTTLRWQKGAHNPFVCLYGILNPHNIKACIEKAMHKQSENDE